MLAVFGVAGCSDDGNNGTDGADASADADSGSTNDAEEEEEVWTPPEPKVHGMSISPTTITVAEADDGDGTMAQVAIFVEDFQGSITQVDAFVETPTGEENAPKQDFLVTSSQIELLNVRMRWFRGLEPGEYNLGVSIESDAGESVKKYELATVTIVEE